jgi:hypothetical protein
MVMTAQQADSMWNHMVKQLTPPDIQNIGSARVDGKFWYTVKLTMPAQEWIRQQPNEEWYEHIDQRYYVDGSRFDISEKLYTALTLKWK